MTLWQTELEWPVSWGDMDAYGHVNNAVFVRWLENARVEWLDAVGFPEGAGVGTPVVGKLLVNFKAPVVFPAIVTVRARAAEVGTTSCTLEYEVSCQQSTDAGVPDDRVVATGSTRIVLVDANGKPTPIPRPARSRLLRYYPPKDSAASRTPATDVFIAGEVDPDRGAEKAAADSLSFDGYVLRWHGTEPAEFEAFSGAADESKKESTPEEGPTPQGKYAIDPKNIEGLSDPADWPAWGRQRVRLEPYRATVQRMMDCFSIVRTGMYVHGGSEKGTHGCLEINDDTQEAAFFRKLKAYGKKIELEVKYARERETRYEDERCPY